MVTMFHPDMDELLATHYCAAHNQPRMKLVSATPARLVFEFKDGTNIGPHDGHMVGVAIDLIDANHHDEEWSWEQDGKRSTTVFHYTRVVRNKRGSSGADIANRGRLSAAQRLKRSDCRPILFASPPSELARLARR